MTNQEPPRLPRSKDKRSKLCPYRSEEVAETAKVCKHCGRDLVPQRKWWELATKAISGIALGISLITFWQNRTNSRKAEKEHVRVLVSEALRELETSEDLPSLPGCLPVGNQQLHEKRKAAGDKIAEAEQIDATDPSVLCARASYLGQERKLEEAAGLCKLALRRSNVKSRECLLAKAEILLEQSKFAESRNTLATRLQQDPTDTRALNLMGLDFVFDGKLDEGITMYYRARASNYQEAFAYDNLAYALTLRSARTGQKDLENALHAEEQALARDPTTLPGGNKLLAQTRLGEILISLDRKNEAVAALLKALDIDDTYEVALKDLGRLYRENGQIGEALALYDRALQHSPDCAQVYFNYGIALWFAHRQADAEVAFRKAIDMYPKYGNAYNRLILLLERQGRSQEAYDLQKKAEENGVDPSKFIGS